MSISMHEFDHCFKQLGNKFIVVGDFNTHHQNWSTRHNRYCNTVYNLVRATEDNSLMQLTYVNMLTYISNTNGTISTLDLCFILAKLFAKGQITRGEDCGSDRCSIRGRINISIQESSISTINAFQKSAVLRKFRVKRSKKHGKPSNKWKFNQYIYFLFFPLFIFRQF